MAAVQHMCITRTPAVHPLAGISPEELQRNPNIAAQADSYGLVDAQGAYLGPKAGAAASVAAVRGECIGEPALLVAAVTCCRVSA
jgi:hypothetical protein